MGGEERCGKGIVRKWVRMERAVLWREGELERRMHPRLSKSGRGPVDWR